MMGEKNDDGHAGAAKKRMKGVIMGLVNTVVVGMLLFIPAGTLDWPMAWVLVGFTVTSFTVNSLMVRPDLIDERIHRHDNAKPLDRYLVMLIVLSGFAAIIVSGFDFRYGWTGSLPPAVPATGFFLLYCPGLSLSGQRPRIRSSRQ